jgi:hypothetical protein
MKQENGRIRIASRPDGSYTLTWLPEHWDGGAARPPRVFPTERDLAGFLTDGLGIEEQVFTEELRSARVDHRVVIIPDVWLSDEEIERHRLGPA